MDLFDLYFSPNGRIDRSTFWHAWFYQILFFGLLVISTVTVVFATGSAALGDLIFFNSSDIIISLIVLFYLVMFPMTLMTYCILIKRYHDRGKSGWWSLIGLVPYIGILLIFVELGFFKGVEETGITNNIK